MIKMLSHDALSVKVSRGGNDPISLLFYSSGDFKRIKSQDILRTLSGFSCHGVMPSFRFPFLFNRKRVGINKFKKLTCQKIGSL